MHRLFLSALCALLVAGCAARGGAPESRQAARFSAEIDSLRKELRIPGLAGAVVRDREVVWSEGMGFADRALGVRARPDTPFHLASLTKPLAATLLMQLVERGAVRLDDPLTKWGIRLGSGAQVWNLLSHTSGGSFHYDGARYALIEGIIGRASGARLEERLWARIVKPLGLRDTAPNTEPDWRIVLGSLGVGERARRDARVYARLARPYRITADHTVARGWYSLEQSASAGLMASALDLAAVDIALSKGSLLGAASREAMWRPMAATSELDGSLYYGLGWFVQYAWGTRLVWHYGLWPPSVSALWLKVPDYGLSLILLANTDGLSSPFPLDEGDALVSAFAMAFARSYVYPRITGKELPAVDWKAPEATLVSTLGRAADPVVRDLLERELWARRQVYASAGRRDLANRLYRVRRAAFPESVREGDRRFVSTLGPVEQEAVRRIGVWGIVWGARAAALWLLATAASILLLVLGTFQPPRIAPATRLEWLAPVAVFGPVALAAAVLGSRLAPHGRPRRAKLVRRSMGRTAVAVLGDALGTASTHAVSLLAAVSVVTALRPPVGLESAILPAMAAALLLGILVRRPLRAAVRGAGYLVSLRRGVLPELASSGIAAAVTSALFLLLERRWSAGADGRSPFLWLAVPTAAWGGLAALLPVLFWALGGGAERDDAPRSRLLEPRTAWPALVACALAVAGSALLIWRLEG